MAVPKRKMSRSNTRSRRAQWKAAPVTLVECRNCHSPEAAARRLPDVRYVPPPAGPESGLSLHVTGSAGERTT